MVPTSYFNPLKIIYTCVSPANRFLNKRLFLGCKRIYFNNTPEEIDRLIAKLFPNRSFRTLDHLKELEETNRRMVVVASQKSKTGSKT